MRSTAANYARLGEFITPYNENLFTGLPAAWALDSAAGLARLANEIQRQAAMIGYLNAFHLLALIAATAIPLTALLRSNK